MAVADSTREVTITAVHPDDLAIAERILVQFGDATRITKSGYSVSTYLTAAMSAAVHDAVIVRNASRKDGCTLTYDVHCAH